jgi:hypothetical protein
MEKGCDAEASSVRPQWGYEPSVRSIRIVPAMNFPVTVGILMTSTSGHACSGDAIEVLHITSGPPDMRTEEPCTGLSLWNTPPHAGDIFTLE